MTDAISGAIPRAVNLGGKATGVISKTPSDRVFEASSVV